MRTLLWLAVASLVPACGSGAEPSLGVELVALASPTPAAGGVPGGVALTPSPSPMLSPVPSVAPPGYRVVVGRSEVLQGEVNWLRVEGQGIASVEGNWGEQRIPFARLGGAYVGLVPVAPDAPPGPGTVLLTISGPGPRPVTLEAYFQVLGATFGEENIQLAEDTLELLDPGVVTAENRYLADFWGVFTPQKLWQGVFDLPVEGKVSSSFGIRRRYNQGPPGSRHGGIDFAAAEGTPVRAPARGRVVIAEELAVRGRVVLLDHGLGLVSGYFHLSRLDVAAGQEVSAGEALGLVGSSGLSSGAHLHWEMRLHGVAVDPLFWTRQGVGLGG